MLCSMRTSHISPTTSFEIREASSFNLVVRDLEKISNNELLAERVSRYISVIHWKSRVEKIPDRVL